MAGFRGGMGGGMNNLVKQAQKIQEQMQAAEKELEELEVVGLSGGGEEGDETVVIYMNGKKVINGVEFSNFRLLLILIYKISLKINQIISNTNQFIEK